MADEENTNEEVAVQSPFDLPEFEGIRPIGQSTSLTGTGNRISRPLELEHKVILLVEAEVIDVNHRKTKDGVKRLPKLKALDYYELEGAEGTKLLNKTKRAFQTADDARHGRKALPGFNNAPKTTEGVTLDKNGVALTADEVAAAHGEEVEPDPVVLIFGDDSRALWPDDYDEDPSEGVGDPEVGEYLVNPNNSNDEELLVVKILDVETGETLAEWTDEDADKDDA